MHAHHSGYYNLVSLIFGHTIPTSFKEMFFTLVVQYIGDIHQHICWQFTVCIQWNTLTLSSFSPEFRIRKTESRNQQDEAECPDTCMYQIICWQFTVCMHRLYVHFYQDTSHSASIVDPGLIYNV